MSKKSFRNVLSPAKVNLCLEVGGRRSDGFHEMQSLVAKLSFGDRISLNIEQSSELSIDLICDQMDLASEENLVVKAARLFSAEMPCFFKAKFFLLKRTPSQSGFGGGSSNAATALMLLAQWYENLVGKKSAASRKKLMAMAEVLGSDVPLFLESSSGVWISGRGERCVPISLAAYPVVLISPSKVRISTPEAYRALKRREIRKNQSLLSSKSEWKRQISSLDWAKRDFLPHQNDFEAWALKQYPSLQRLKQELCESGALTGGMSGSGSGFYGIYESSRAARLACQYFIQRGYWAVETKVSG